MTKVVNKYKDAYDVYIGRGSEWGNPFIIGVHGERDEVIAAYRKLTESKLANGTLSVKSLLSLEGKTLGCYCKPKACHGDVLVALIKKYKDTHSH